jgi:peptide/nickel transport system permease protein
MTADPAPAMETPRSWWRRPGMGVFRVVGLALLLLNAALAIFGTFAAPHSASEIVGGAFGPPSDVALIGTDYIGRDLLSRLLLGAKYSFGIAFVATVIGFAVGVSIGFASAELRGAFDTIVTWCCDILLSFPSILLALIVITAAGTSIPVLVGTIALIQVPRVVRLSRSIAAGISPLEFVDVARTRGEGLASILVREIAPNTVRPLAVEFGLRMSFAVLFMSSLSFLGLGIQPPEADWGSMVRENLPGVYYTSLASLLPALLIGSLVLGINLTIDALSGGLGRSGKPR